MQNDNVQSLRKVSLKFSDFCNTKSRLSKSTPVFMTDERGRLVAKKHMRETDRGFDAVCEMVEDGEYSEYVKIKHCRDGFILKASDNYSKKSYLAMTNEGDGLFGGVVCSYSAESCNTIGEYLEKLSIYKQYIDDVSYEANEAANVFDRMICGVGGLMKLSSQNGGAKARSLFDLKGFFEKIAMFSERAARLSSLACEITVCGDNPAVGISERFVSAAVCCLGLAVRNSKNGKVSVCINDCDDGAASISISCEKETDISDDMYSKAVEDAVKEHCESVEINRKNGNIYSIKIVIKKALVERLTVSEISFAEKTLEQQLSERQLSDIFFAITDI